MLVADAPTSSWLTAAIVAVAFILANLLWSLLLASLATYGRTIVRATTFRWINAATAVCMAICGVGLCWQTVAAVAPFLN